MKLEITTKSLKAIVEDWWTEWNLHPQDEIPDSITEILMVLDLEGTAFNLTEGNWEKSENFIEESSN